MKIKTDGTAFIIFGDILDAYFAQIYLNEREIDEDKIKLKVEWCTQIDIIENSLKVPKKEVIEENKSAHAGNISNFEFQFLQMSLNNIKNEDV